jgi:hypothetical protein
VRTPNLDRLAADGVRFAGAYLGSWCMPSRATILTGRHPHGVESMRMEGPYPASTYDPRQAPFVFAEFRRQGYQTAHIGKWHTGTDAGWGRDWDHQVVWNRPKHPDNAGAYYEQQVVAIDGVEQTVDGYPADNYTRWAVEYIKGGRPGPGQAVVPVALLRVGPRAVQAGRPAQGHVQGRGRPSAGRHLPAAAGQAKYLDETQAWSRGEGGEISPGRAAGGGRRTTSGCGR